MLPAYLLSLREGIEAALIIGIVLGALYKVRRPELARWVWAGAGVAALVSLAAAVALTMVGFRLEGRAEELFEAVTMFAAAGILTWMVFWMGRQSRHLKAELEAGVASAALGAGAGALFWLAFMAVVREGLELALFLTAAVFAGDAGDASTTAAQAVVGAVLGLGTAALLGWSLFATTVRLDLRRFFQVTSVLLVLFAAGLVAHGVHELNEAGVIPPVVEPVWDAGAILPADSFLGAVAATLFGYNPDPSLTEVLAYVGYLAFVGIALAWSARARPREAAPQPGT
jgi:high-affinity iron transporter